MERQRKGAVGRICIKGTSQQLLANKRNHWIQHWTPSKVEKQAYIRSSIKDRGINLSRSQASTALKSTIPTS